jgi:hypothetical protein
MIGPELPGKIDDRDAAAFRARQPPERPRRPPVAVAAEAAESPRRPRPPGAELPGVVVGEGARDEKEQQQNLQESLNARIGEPQ